MYCPNVDIAMYLTTMLDGEVSSEGYIEGWYSSKGIEDHLIYDCIFILVL